MAHTDLVGRVFGRLVVVCAEGRSAYGYVLWRCRCECGGTKLIVGPSLVRGLTRSCGCLQRELVSVRSTTHGASHTSLYKRWDGIKSRCFCVSHPSYPDYGGRGITVCDRWLSFQAFAEDMGPTFDSSLEIERIDNSGNYEPSNCRWTTSKEQGRNKRSSHRVTIRGVTKTLAEWSESSGTKLHTLRWRVLKGWPEELLFDSPSPLQRSRTLALQPRPNGFTLGAEAKNGTL